MANHHHLQRASTVSSTTLDNIEKLCLNDSAVDDYENPVTWHKKYKVHDGHLTKDVLFDNMDMKNIIDDQYGDDKPEYIRWKL